MPRIFSAAVEATVMTGHRIHYAELLRRARTDRRDWRLAAVALVAVVWLVATEPWGIRVYQLIVFMAPGALLGLAAGWMAYAADQPRWSWRSGLRWALAGALALPPILAFLIIVDGNARPHRLLAGFIRAAWLALAAGLSVATARALSVRSQQRRQKVRGALE